MKYVTVPKMSAFVLIAWISLAASFPAFAVPIFAANETCELSALAADQLLPAVAALGQSIKKLRKNPELYDDESIFRRDLIATELVRKFGQEGNERLLTQFKQAVVTTSFTAKKRAQAEEYLRHLQSNGQSTGLSPVRGTAVPVPGNPPLNEIRLQLDLPFFVTDMIRSVVYTVRSDGREIALGPAYLSEDAFGASFQGDSTVWSIKAEIKLVNLPGNPAPASIEVSGEIAAPSL